MFLICSLFFSSKANALTFTPVRMEINGNPGQVLSEEMTLINERPTTETYYSSYMNFEAQGETGTPNFVEAHDDLGTWMKAQPSITLAPGQSKIVPITITIPKDADAGGHFAAVFWGTTPNTPAGGGQVTIGAKSGILILLRVNGAVNENGGVLEFSTKNKQSFFTSLPVTFYYRFQNSGNDRIKPAGSIKMQNIIGLTSAKISGNPVEGNILPKSVRKFETVWKGVDGLDPVEEKDQGNFFNKVGREWRNFAFGRYNAKLSLSYGTKNEIATGSFVFWVIPWHLLVFIIILILFVYFTGRKILRKYNHWVIMQAEEMLKNEQMKNSIPEPVSAPVNTPPKKPQIRI